MVVCFLGHMVFHLHFTSLNYLWPHNPWEFWLLGTLFQTEKVPTGTPNNLQVCLFHSLSVEGLNSKSAAGVGICWQEEPRSRGLPMIKAIFSPLLSLFCCCVGFLFFSACFGYWKCLLFTFELSSAGTCVLILIYSKASSTSASPPLTSPHLMSGRPQIWTLEVQ